MLAPLVMRSAAYPVTCKLRQYCRPGLAANLLSTRADLILVTGRADGPTFSPVVSEETTRKTVVEVVVGRNSTRGFITYPQREGRSYGRKIREVS